MRHLIMINVVAVCLVLSTLAAAGVWSPAPPAPAVQQQQAEHVLREGRRVVIVEYERELPHTPGHGAAKETRVLYPHGARDGGEAEDGSLSDKAREAVSEAADKASGVAEEGKEKLYNAKESTTGKVFGAVRRCKDRLCGAAKGAEDGASRVKEGAEDAVRGAGETLSGAKDRAEDTVLDAASGAKEAAATARDKVAGAAGEAKEKAAHIKDGAAGTVRNAKHKVSEAAGEAKEKASQVKDKAAETVTNAKGKVSEAAGEAKEKASHVKDKAADTVTSAKGKVSEAAKNAKDKASDIAERAEDYAEDAAESAAEKVARAEEVAKAKAGEVSKNLTDILRRAREVASDAGAYLLGAPMEAARTAMAMMHLLGFAIAYGTCVWVTFVSSHVLAAALPRQQLGVVQSKLYPVYFRAMAYCIGLALAAHVLGRERGSFAARAQSFNLLSALGLVLANMLLLEPKATKVMFERMKVEKEEGRGRDMADIIDPPAVTVATAATTTTTTTPTAAGARIPVDGTATVRAAKTTTTKSPVTAPDAEMAKSKVVSLSKRLKQLNGYSSLCNVLSLMALTWHLVHLARRLQMSTAC
ncbi:uncharacterized protein LOC124670700 [Lolium rigidum]|uniref:uncharacterized protein LOC124670700 n=1 Tax=Lolium rigidum TaxID=89674 RepID=UPI001F5CA470|nr:uncharacterized protein LOC124670700 [Lolium rigidum]